jgi:hypothetical protein
VYYPIQVGIDELDCTAKFVTRQTALECRRFAPQRVGYEHQGADTLTVIDDRLQPFRLEPVRQLRLGIVTRIDDIQSLDPSIDVGIRVVTSIGSRTRAPAQVQVRAPGQ